MMGEERAGKAGSSRPYRDWPGQTAGSIEELAIGMVEHSFCLLVISTCKLGYLQESVVGDPCTGWG